MSELAKPWRKRAKVVAVAAVVTVAVAVAAAVVVAVAVIAAAETAKSDVRVTRSCDLGASIQSLVVHAGSLMRFFRNRWGFRGRRPWASWLGLILGRDMELPMVATPWTARQEASRRGLERRPRGALFRGA